MRKYCVELSVAVVAAGLLLANRGVAGNPDPTNAPGPTTVTNASGGSCPAPVPKTGQTSSYADGDDGAAVKGVAWPNPRFTDNRNGTVKDNLTGLIWLKDANAFGGRSWTNALADCAALKSGAHGLSDGSVEGDWRLPNWNELRSLIDASRYDPALPSGHPFTGVRLDSYWSSTTIAGSKDHAWDVTLYGGDVNGGDKATAYFVWPVRGGD